MAVWALWCPHSQIPAAVIHHAQSLDRCHRSVSVDMRTSWSQNFFLQQEALTHSDVAAANRRTDSASVPEHYA